MGGSAVTIASLICLAAAPSWAQIANQPTSRVVVCESKPGERQACAADTSSGVALVKSPDRGACLLGKTWGYDDTSVWVSGGCSGEFVLGLPAPQPASQTTVQTTPVPTQQPAPPPTLPPTPVPAGQPTEQPAPPKYFGKYTPNRGYKLVNTEKGDLNVKLYTYVRYLDQKQLDPSYTDSFGNTSAVQQRQDIQVNKVIIYFLGWILSPKFRYFTYVWTTNVSQGQSAQVIVAGNLTYSFNDHFNLGVGIASLPGVRSTEGNFPFWLPIDNRSIADEFFRPSYTTGIFANGTIVHGLEYHIMLGNNLSQLGIDAGQLDNGLNTWSGALVWMPTTGEYGDGRYGDFEDHQQLATRLAVHYTRSDENRQSQPATDSFDNVQIRLSDGNSIFKPGLFGPGINVEDVTYHMLDLDAGLKYRGFSLAGEYYRRLLDNFRGSGTTGLANIGDNGFQLQGSAMVLPRTLQLYAATSMIFGNYGNPWDARLGINWFPWKVQEVRANFEYIQLHRSPVGGLSLPYPVGGNGPVFDLNLAVNF